MSVSVCASVHVCSGILFLRARAIIRSEDHLVKLKIKKSSNFLSYDPLKNNSF